MMDVKAVQEAAEKEFREEQMKSAKGKIVVLLKKKAQAQQVVANIERELADAYAEIGQGSYL